MITNERQYKVTKAQADRLAKTPSALERNFGDRGGIHLRLAKAQQEALKSQIADLCRQLAEYESMNAGKAPIGE